MTEPGEPDAAEPVTWAGISGRGWAAMAVAGVALLVALGWSGAALVGLPAAWTGGGSEPPREPATPLEAAQAAGFAVQACPDEAGARTCLIYEPDWENSRSFAEDMAEDMAALAAQADALDLAGLDLRHADGLASLEPLQGMRFWWLDLSGATGITSLAPLRGLDPKVIRGASPALLATLER